MSFSTNRKRKHAPTYRPQPTTAHDPDPTLTIQTHEADVISGPQAQRYAQSLEIEVLPSGTKRIGDALIQWDAARSDEVERDSDGSVREGGDGVWVDRYGSFQDNLLRCSV